MSEKKEEVKAFKIEPTKTVNVILSKLSLPIKLAQMKLEDGVTVVEAEEFAPEYSVGIVQEGGIVPAPAGEHTLEDGRVMIVEPEGQIQSVGEAVVASENKGEVSSTPAPAPTKVVETVEKSTFFSLQEASKELAEEHTVALSKIETLEAEKSSLETEKSELEAKVVELEKNKPVKQVPERNTVAFEDMTPIERFRAQKIQNN